MYLIFGCMLAIVLFVLLFCGYRRRKARKKVCAMSCGERLEMVEALISPFGYCYDRSQDCYSTLIDAPQRRFGYTALYDRYAARFGMVFDCMPVYFDYRGKTWLIEFWKGQYGINAGCEVGIYKADGLVASISRKTALFHSVEDEEMLPVSVRLYHKGKPLCQRCERHWWLTMFRMGDFCEPRDLEMRAGMIFPNAEMLNAFVGALREQGDVECTVRGLQVQILFRVCTSCRLSFFRRMRCRYAQWKNRICCKLFLWVTKPFECGMDRLLCLYFCLPRLIRRMLCTKKRECCRRKSCRGYKKEKCCRRCKKNCPGDQESCCRRKKNCLGDRESCCRYKKNGGGCRR